MNEHEKYAIYRREDRAFIGVVSATSRIEAAWKAWKKWPKYKRIYVEPPLKDLPPPKETQ